MKAKDVSHEDLRCAKAFVKVVEKISVKDFGCHLVLLTMVLNLVKTSKKGKVDGCINVRWSGDGGLLHPFEFKGCLHQVYIRTQDYKYSWKNICKGLWVSFSPNDDGIESF